MKLFTIKKLLLIPAVLIGIGIFSGVTLADETSCLVKSFFNEGVGMTCKWDDWGHDECSQSGISPDPYVCASIGQENICEKYGCTWVVDTCTGAGITAFTENNFYQYCNMESIPQCYTEMNEDACLQAGCIFTEGEFMEPSTCVPPTVGSLPAFQEGDVTTILGSLTIATQGILDFIVSGGALWFVVAGALILLYYFRKVLSLKKATAKQRIDQKKSMKHFANRQRSLQELRRRRY